VLRIGCFEKPLTEGDFSLVQQSYFNDDCGRHSFIRLGFASLNLKELEEAVEILEKAVKKAL
jgi:GntR family transcriptional regulator/MocR family aminotransferase